MKFNLCHKDEGCNKIHNIRIRGTIARPDDPMGKIGVEPTLGGEKGVSWIMDVQWDFLKKYILIRFWVLYLFFFYQDLIAMASVRWVGKPRILPSGRSLRKKKTLALIGKNLIYTLQVQ